MNLISDDESLEPNEYVLAINLRNRFMYGEASRQPLLISSPDGIKQGLYSFESIQILFCAGYAYYRLLTDTSWTMIAGFKMDSTVEYIYALAVPTSTVNFARTSAGINVASTVGGSSQCLIVQDGINQPFVIFPNGTCRKTKTYDDWIQTTDQEYVPIGKQMAYFQGIVFVLSSDGRSIFRSVTGRPLDFMVNVTALGNKGGDVTTVAHSVGYEKLTAIHQATADALFVASEKNCWLLTPNYDITIFGEPTFINQAIAGAGCLNQFCVTDVLGDVAFLDKDGVKSFNAVQQLKWRGRNSVFSQKVTKLFEGIKQTVACCVSFNNYAFFSIQTPYGYGTLVYDTLRTNWSSLDIGEHDQFKQFSVNTEGNDARLFAITGEEVYELESSAAEFAVPTLMMRSFVPWNKYDHASLQVSRQLKLLRVLITDTVTEGTLLVRETMDGIGGAFATRTLKAAATGIRYPVLAPVVPNDGRSINNLSIPMDGKRGRKLSITLNWSGGGKLMQVETVDDLTQQDSAQFDV